MAAAMCTKSRNSYQLMIRPPSITWDRAIFSETPPWLQARLGEVGSGGFDGGTDPTTTGRRVEQRTQPRTGIPAAELHERRERLLEHVRRDGLSGYVLFGADYIQYFTGFWFLSNERPVIYAESVGGESAVFVPEFEVERTRAEAAFARIASYPEYPGIEHPMSILARVARGPRDQGRNRR